MIILTKDDELRLSDTLLNLHTQLYQHENIWVDISNPIDSEIVLRLLIMKFKQFLPKIHLADGEDKINAPVDLIIACTGYEKYNGCIVTGIPDRYMPLFWWSEEMKQEYLKETQILGVQHG